ncbi:hypothetical protein HZC09_00170 [Candidatus Micrarchaeota archaeon]|nr:hypothetical protein [Candidatus Micrarchaeota archaeon]
MASPIKTVKMQFPHHQVKVDVAVWEGRAHEGKPLPSSLSVRLNDLPDASKPVVYLSIEEATNVANVLTHLAFMATEHDSKRRIEAWKMRSENLKQASEDYSPASEFNTPKPSE